MNKLYNDYEMSKHGFTLEKEEKKEIDDYLNGDKELKDCDFTTTALVEIFFKRRERDVDYLNINNSAFKLLRRNNYSLKDIPETMHDFICCMTSPYIFNLKTRGLDINKFCYLRFSEFVSLNGDDTDFDPYKEKKYDEFKNNLLDHIDVNLKDKSGSNILFYPMGQDKLNRLLKNKIDVNAVNNSGMNALFNCDYETAKKLICHGIDIYQTDFLKRNALFYCGSNFEKAKMLVDNGMNVNQLDAMGRTPLFYAESKDVLQLYLNEGGDRNIVDRNGQTAFQFIRDKILEDKTSLYNNIGIEFLFNIEKEHIVTELGLGNKNNDEEIKSTNRRRL
ncbi:ankyrin repeat domain-containing protein [Enterobacter hormaechei]|uniref:ankyrin repeat domain-containing protein n=1 Tax=Enterobacter hormaechei TaxID=158836 RepID=UPI0006971C25|nr:ankyrin repeat domain-containing protein [Enterobacter hormaechei]